MSQWNVDLYEDKHSYVWQYGENLLDMLDPKSEETILDLGCGTGQLTAQIAESGAVVIGLDSAESAISQCRKNYPQIEFIVANGADFSLETSFDAVFSNAALHWIKPPAAAIDCIYRVLKPAGRFVAEFGGKDNIKQIIKAIDTTLAEPEDSLWYFPSIGEYSSLLEKAGFKVNYAVLFDRPTKLEGENGLVNWLEMFANDRFKNLSPITKKAALDRIESLLHPHLYREGNWWADYCRIRIVAIKSI